MNELTVRRGVSEVEELIPAREVRALQILSGALLAGALLFGLVVVGMHFGGVFSAPAAEPGAEERGLIALLSLVHAGVFVLSWIVSGLLPPVILRGVVRASRSRPDRGLAPLLVALRGAHMVQCAFREGPALFGLVICLVASLHGVLAESPLYWLNAASAGALLAWGLAAFPTRERLLARLQRALESAGA